MSINAPQGEQPLSDLRRVIAKLRASICDNTLTSSDLILGCRQILDLWIEGGGSSPDDPVVGFTGIESQTCHVLGGPSVQAGRDVDRMRFESGSNAENAEIEDIGRFFGESFKQAIDELAVYLTDR